MRPIPHCYPGRRTLRWVLTVAVLLSAATCLQAAEPLGPLFDRFSLKLAGDFASLDTTVRADDKNGVFPGTEINFESDLGLADTNAFGELSFQLLLGRRHRLGFLYDNVSRSGVKTIATEIRFEDVVFPVNAELESSFRSRSLGVNYTFFFLRLGMDDLDVVDISVEASTEFPQPQIGVEYRQMFGEKWRFIAAASGLAVNLSDGDESSFDGSLFNAHASIEHLTFKYASFGGGLFTSFLNATLEDEDDRQEVDTSAYGGQVFVRFRLP